MEEYMSLIYITTAVLIVLLLGSLKTKNEIQKLKRQGLYPDNREGTLDDVKRLVEQGYKVAAIRLYREIKKVGLKEANLEVDKLDIKNN